MRSRFSWFNATAITLGFAFLYIPILLLVIYSFNESKLVTVWGGWSTKWYGSLLENQSLKDAAWVTIRVAFLSATVATALGTLAAITLVRHRPLPGAHAVFGHDLRAARDARGYHRLVPAIAVRRARS